jgi:cytochrome c oxidase subunit 1
MAAIPYSHPLPSRAPALPGWLARLVAWLGVVDHKRIGALYIAGGTVFLLAGGIEAVLIRLQLWQPNAHLVSAQLYNQLFTMHGTTMIFFAATPLIIGFENLVVPLMIGARDVAFPRMNALSLWLFMAGGLVLNSGWLLGGSPDAGWFAYTPISGRLYNPGQGIDWYTLGLQLSGAGTIMTAVNFLVTIVNMRTRGLGFMRLPLFVWATLLMSVLILFAFPPLTVNLFLLTFDRLIGTQFFNPSAGGAPLLWANLFWIFGHPEVYILILPEFGIISEVVSTFTRKPLFGYTTMVGAILAIAFLSFMVWVHHMFTLGYGPWVNSIFSLTSMLIAVPTGVKVFNWLATMWRGYIHMTTAMHYVLGVIITFVIGGMSGVMLAMAPADLQYNDTYFVVAHFHYTIIGGVVFGLLAASYYWFPLLTGRLMDETLGKIGFWIQFAGFNATFFPQHFLGLTGMPRRVFTYPPGLGYTLWNQVSTVGALVLAAGLGLWLFNLVWSARAGRRAADDPWDARTLEWAVGSPPPPYNFARLPLVRGRDPLWVEKHHGDGRLLPAPDPEREGDTVRMPAPDATPAALALGMTGFAYAALYRSPWGMLAAAAVAVLALYRYMFRPMAHVSVPVRDAPS